jgi:phosphate transport system protein
MERQFDEELAALKETLMRMATLVEESIALSVQALKDRNEELIQHVLVREETINGLDVEIEQRSLKLIALRQPMASDLRMIVAAMKMGGELERIGDQAVNLAERAQELLKVPLLKPLLDIPRMASLAQKMVRDSIRAFIDQDAVLAKNVCERDDEVDELYDQVFRELLTYTIADPTTIPRAVELILISRHLERIADHATNISEDVIYQVEGRTIKHHFEEKHPPEMKG